MRIARPIGPLRCRRLTFRRNLSRHRLISICSKPCESAKSDAALARQCGLGIPILPAMTENLAKFHCKLGPAVPIEPVLRSLFPENGNISSIRRRLSANPSRKRPNPKSRDRPPIRKSPHWRAFLAFPAVKSLWDKLAGEGGFEPQDDELEIRRSCLSREAAETLPAEVPK